MKYKCQNELCDELIKLPETLVYGVLECPKYKNTFMACRIIKCVNNSEKGCVCDRITLRIRNLKMGERQCSELYLHW